MYVFIFFSLKISWLCEKMCSCILRLLRRNKKIYTLKINCFVFNLLFSNNLFRTIRKKNLYEKKLLAYNTVFLFYISVFETMLNYSSAHQRNWTLLFPLMCIKANLKKYLIMKVHHTNGCSIYFIVGDIIIKMWSFSIKPKLERY